MKKFRFSLESVLGQRLREENQALHELGQVMEKYNQTRTRFQHAQDNVSECQRKLAGFMSSRMMNPASLRNYYVYLGEMRKVEERCREELAEADEKLSKAREAYRDKKARTDILVRLREKCFADYMKQLDKIEAREMDDRNTIQYLRQNRQVA